MAGYNYDPRNEDPGKGGFEVNPLGRALFSLLFMILVVALFGGGFATGFTVARLTLSDANKVAVAEQPDEVHAGQAARHQVQAVLLRIFY